MAKHSNISVTVVGGAYVVKTPYDAGFVNELKSLIPGNARKYDAFNKTWTVSGSYWSRLALLLNSYFGYTKLFPPITATNDAPFVTEIVVEYVAACKDGFASIQIDGNWAGKITEAALCSWFKVERPEPDTLYGLLGCSRTATSDEIKAGFKAAARAWHPDLNRAENARDMFEKVKQAYDLLSSEAGRAKYDAALQFEAMAGGKKPTITFTPPLKCGRLKVKARRELGSLVIDEILEWRDVKNENGRTMFSSWSGSGVSVLWV